MPITSICNFIRYSSGCTILQQISQPCFSFTVKSSPELHTLQDPDIRKAVPTPKITVNLVSAGLGLFYAFVSHVECQYIQQCLSIFKETELLV